MSGTKFVHAQATGPAAVLVGGLVLAIAVAMVGCTDKEGRSGRQNDTASGNPNSDSLANAPENTPTSADDPLSSEVAALLQYAGDATADGDWGLAYDYLLAAMARDAGHPDVFAAVCKYIEQGLHVDPATVYAEDLLERADLMIAYLPPDSIKGARERHNGLVASVSLPALAPDRPAKLLVERLERLDKSGLPATLKLRGALTIQQEFEDARIDQALDGMGDRLTADEVQQVMRALEVAQRKFLAEAYLDVRTRYVDWANNVAGKLINEVNGGEVTYDRRMAIDEELLAAIKAGGVIMTEISPYADSDVVVDVAGSQKVAKDDFERLVEVVTQSQRTREWNYNVTALASIRELEASEASAFERCNLLVRNIDEARLQPYVAERRDNLFKELYDQLDDGQKVAITKSQILREMNK